MTDKFRVIKKRSGEYIVQMKIKSFRYGESATYITFDNGWINQAPGLSSLEEARKAILNMIDAKKEYPDSADDGVDVYTMEDLGIKND